MQKTKPGSEQRREIHIELLWLTQKWKHIYTGFPSDLDSKESACNAGDPGLIPGSERSPGEGKVYPL